MSSESTLTVATTVARFGQRARAAPDSLVFSLVAGQATPATKVLERAGVPFRLHSYPHRASRGYGVEAAGALGVEEARVFKTLLAEVDGNLTVGVVPVSASLDLKALAAAMGGKRARMADPRSAERATGYVAGGISPLGQCKRLPTVVDDTAEGFATIYCSAGRRGLEVELAPADLVRLTGARLGPISA